MAGTARGGCPRDRLCAQARFWRKSARHSRSLASPGRIRRARPAADVRAVACVHRLVFRGNRRGTRVLWHLPGGYGGHVPRRMSARPPVFSLAYPPRGGKPHCSADADFQVMPCGERGARGRKSPQRRRPRESGKGKGRTHLCVRPPIVYSSTALYSGVEICVMASPILRIWSPMRSKSVSSSE